jgi:DNA gyrase subunit B
MSVTIQAMGDIEHIRQRPGMYIGDTNSPDHLITEVLDNSLDELANGYATAVAVDINPDNSVTITDNGRGIPIQNVQMPDGSFLESPIAIATQAKTGGKFDNSGYKNAIGLHGIGLTAVNALSTRMNLILRNPINKDEVINYYFQDSTFHSKIITKDSNSWTTQIVFAVDPQYFVSAEYDLDKLRKRLELVSAHNPDHYLLLNNDQIKVNSLYDYAKQEVGADTLEHVSIADNIDIFFTYDSIGRQAHTIKGDVNLNICEGTYLTNSSTLIYNCVKEYLEETSKLTKNDILSYLKMYVSVTVPEPKFDSQIKTKMTKNMSSVINKLKGDVSLKIPLFKEHFEFITNLKSNKKAKKTLGSRGKRVSSGNPLKDCKNSPGKILYILEGDSAGGTLLEIRNAKDEAIFPLSGKIENTINKSIGKVTEKEKGKVKYLLEAIGVGKRRFRYDNVKIICDADADGMHIVVLVLIALWRYAPSLITEKRVSIIVPPLYGALKKKHPMIPIYDESLIDQYSSNGFEVKRFKGLGEMSADHLEVVTKQQPVEYILQPPLGEESGAIMQCITNVDLKRRLCQDVERFNISRLFSSAQ